MERLQGLPVCSGERSRQLGGRVSLALLEALAGEGEASEQPHQSLSRDPLLLALLVLDEQLQGLIGFSVRFVASAHFLDVGSKVQ